MFGAFKADAFQSKEQEASESDVASEEFGASDNNHVGSYKKHSLMDESTCGYGGKRRCLVTSPCFFCDGHHRVCDCPKRKEMSSMFVDDYSANEEGEALSVESQPSELDNLEVMVATKGEEGNPYVDEGRNFEEVTLDEGRMAALVWDKVCDELLDRNATVRLGIPHEKRRRRRSLVPLMGEAPNALKA
ncbi:unnamed protein product [Linum trigynum]|uniref:Uncharacterized protein n=1 Tax=Linum trigynum TaxID=586398 RepID=A0AAV2E3L8_9ROSI